MKPLIPSLLDNDLYKFSMGQAILFGRSAGIAYESIDVEYDFINRGGTDLSGIADALRHQINCMADLQLTDCEHKFLQESCPYLKRSYLDFLSSYRFNPSEVDIDVYNRSMFVNVHGPWYRCVLWEVPLLALISELYHQRTLVTLHGTNYLDIVEHNASEKAMRLSEAICLFSDFGTRRRIGLDIHDRVVRGLIHGAKYRSFVGTSNVYLAMKYGLTPIGTMAHEFPMAHAALFGYKLANRYAMESWVNEYDGSLGIALPDTFTSKIFFEQFTLKLSKLFDGVRQDSGSPIEFANMAIDHYNKMKIDPRTKTIVFSDNLTVDKAIEIQKWCDGKIRCAFGIGTHFTADLPGIKPLNIVMKLSRCNDSPVVKLSDDIGKYTGDPETIYTCKQILGIP